MRNVYYSFLFIATGLILSSFNGVSVKEPSDPCDGLTVEIETWFSAEKGEGGFELKCKGLSSDYELSLIPGKGLDNKKASKDQLYLHKLKIEKLPAGEYLAVLRDKEKDCNKSLRFTIK